MKVMVLGATGLTGGMVVEKLMRHSLLASQRFDSTGGAGTPEL